MKSTMEILTKLQENSQKNHDEIFTRLYRYLLRPDIYFIAYQHLYSNKGAGTKGVNDDTADGFSEQYVTAIIEALRTGSYEPKPVRRTYIQKKNGKLRPLGLPVFADKLVQEAIRMILEAIYEPIFSIYSHGFRPGRSCHTALAMIKHEFTGAKWFIEGDIKGCFDNIDHSTLIGVLNRKIKDARFLNLIRMFLKSGYMEDWGFHETYSGCPQGGIISPILANIYLNELDRYITQLKKEFDHGYNPRNFTEEYNTIRHKRDEYRDGTGAWGVPYETKKGKRRMMFAKYSDCKGKDLTEKVPDLAYRYSHNTTSFEERLKAKVCEVCGCTDSDSYEIHHVNKVKNLKGKADWEKVMLAKRRKTIVVCHKCHMRIHHGTKTE